jgi:hypothetical protein
VVVLDAVAQDRRLQRDAPLPPELVPAVRDPVQVGVVVVVRAPAEIRPDDECRVRLGPVERQAGANDHRRAEFVARRIARDGVVEPRRVAEGDVHGAVVAERHLHLGTGGAIVLEGDGVLATVRRDDDWELVARVEAAGRVDEGREAFDPNDVRGRAAGAVPRRVAHARLCLPGPDGAGQRRQPVPRILVTDRQLVGAVADLRP